MLPEYDGETGVAYTHPYLHELECFRPAEAQLESVPEASLSSSVPSPPDPASSSLALVDTLESLKAMTAALSREEVVAVDTEQHWYRSYQGFICLIQVPDSLH